MQTNQSYSYSPGEFEFVAVDVSHIPMLREWLCRPHIAEWWEDPETEIGYVRDMLAGRDSTKPFIFMLDGKPCGYIQAWFIGDAQTSEWIEKEPWLAELPPEAVGIDVLIADEVRLSQGIGSSVVGAFAELLKDHGHEKIIIDPDPENARAVRAYEKAGFNPSFTHEATNGRTLIMEYNPERSGLNA